jgi:hypothetical protein
LKNIETYRVRGNELREQIKQDIKYLLFQWLDRLKAKNLDEKSFVEFLSYNRARLKECDIVDDEEFDNWTTEWLEKNNV